MQDGVLPPERFTDMSGEVENLFHSRLFGRMLFANRDAFLLELQNSTLSIIVGLIFLIAWAVGVNLYDDRPNLYRYMDWIGSWFWGTIFATAGAIHLVSLRGEFQYVRKHVLLLKTGLWVYIGVCVLSGDSFAVSGWFYLIFAAFAFRTFLRVQVDKYVAPTGRRFDGLAQS